VFERDIFFRFDSVGARIRKSSGPKEPTWAADLDTVCDPAHANNFTGGIYFMLRLFKGCSTKKVKPGKIICLRGVLGIVEISSPGRFFWPAGLSYSRANAVEPEKNVTFEHNGASSVCTTSVSAYTRGPLTDAAQRCSPAAVGTRELKLSFATSRFLCALDAGLWRVCERVEPTHDA
jgi:hypothetical protein